MRFSANGKAASVGASAPDRPVGGRVADEGGLRDGGAVHLPDRHVVRGVGPENVRRARASIVPQNVAHAERIERDLAQRGAAH
jgi:hypothetical protein